MEYYIVRIYRRGPCHADDGDLHDIRITGLVEDYNGHKELFHDSETLWRLLARESKAMKTKRPESKG